MFSISIKTPGKDIGGELYMRGGEPKTMTNSVTSVVIGNFCVVDVTLRAGQGGGGGGVRVFNTSVVEKTPVEGEGAATPPTFTGIVECLLDSTMRRGKAGFGRGNVSTTLGLSKTAPSGTGGGDTELAGVYRSGTSGGRGGRHQPNTSYDPKIGAGAGARNPYGTVLLDAENGNAGILTGVLED